MWEQSLVHSPFAIQRQTNIVSAVFFYRKPQQHRKNTPMLSNKSKQHLIALAMLTVTTIIWGAGFALSSTMVGAGGSFEHLPHFSNVLRFGLASIVLVAVFFKKLKTNWQTIRHSMVGAVFMYGGFALQLLGLKYTTAASCGFFTAAYVMFVPFIAWAWQRKAPRIITWCGVGVAVIGLIIFNGTNYQDTPTAALGNMLSLLGALVLAFQITWTEYCLSKNKVDNVNLTVWQVVFSTVLFVGTSLVFEGKDLVTYVPQIHWASCWWKLAIISLGGTAFAYVSQTYAQKHLTSSETSLIMVCESPIGALISVLLGRDLFTWQLAVGGLLIITAVFMVEIIPSLLAKKE